MSDLGKRVKRGIQLYPVTVGALIAFAVASVALGLVLNEQAKGRSRDEQADTQRKDLRRTDKQLGNAIIQIQRTRQESVKIGCKTNQGQNNVLLAIINLSIENARRDGRDINEADLQAVRNLLKPITPEATRKVCDALLEKVQEGPPPPP